VASGAAEFGISNSSLVISRAKGADVVVVAPVFQHSPFVIIAARGHGIKSVSDLAGLRVMVEADAKELIAYLRSAGVSESDIESVPHDGNPLALRDSGIHAATAYTTTEPYSLIREGVPFQIFNPRELGIDFYGDTLFTSGDFARQHPERVRAFRDATLAGWQYALAHTDEIIDVIRADYAPGSNRRLLEFEAEEIKRLMIADVVDLGYVSTNRWRHIAGIFESVGMLEPGFSLDGFLFDAAEPAIPAWLALPSGLALIAIIVLGWTSHRFYRMNRALHHEVAHRRELEAELTRLATRDDLTGLPNRRHFFTFGASAFRKAREEGRPLSVILLDLDRFKSINDTWGHEAGDDALRRVAKALRRTLPRDYELGRLGGEEFAAILPDTPHMEAIAHAEHIRTALGTILLPSDADRESRVTASIGVVTAGDSDSNFDDVVARADRAMYKAKNSGRNRVGTGLAA
jgi:diguanylate cyclase (GGDEF)-like protein